MLIKLFHDTDTPNDHVIIYAFKKITQKNVDKLSIFRWATFPMGFRFLTILR